MRTAALLLLLALPAAAKGPGASVAPILKLGLGARPAAMGGAFVAVSDDANASAWNPAGLALTRRAEAALSHSALFQSLSYDYLSFAVPVTRWGGMGGHVAYLSSGRIDKTFEDPGGAFDANASGGSFTDSDLKLNVALAGAPSEGVGLGAGLTYLKDRVDQNSADGVMADAGFLVKEDIFGFGLSLDNAGPKFTGDNALPTVLRSGASARPAEGLTLALEYDRHLDSEQNVFGVGGEYWLAEAFALRLGYAFGSRDNAGGVRLTGGFGARLGAFELDYAFSPFGQLGDAHQISLGFRFGKERGKRDDKPSNEPPPMRGDVASDTPEQHFDRADALLTAKNYPGAKQELAASLALLASEDRRRIRYFDGMGAVALAQGDFSAGQAAYADALRLGASLGLSDPSVAEAYAGMGFCLAGLGNPSFAVRYLEKALEFGPSPATREAAKAKLKELRRLLKSKK